MKQNTSLSLFFSDAFESLPKAAQHLARRAIHAVDRSAEGRPENVDRLQITEMVRECVKMVGGYVNGDGWMMALGMIIATNRSNLERRWPSIVVNVDDHVYTQSVDGKLFASIAIWRIDMAIRAIRNNNRDLAIDEIALAGLALHIGGIFEGGLSVDSQHSYQRRMAASRAAIASHTTHNDNMKIARSWYDAHKTMTKDAAAQKMHDEGVVHASFRTIRGYLIGQ